MQRVVIRWDALLILSDNLALVLAQCKRRSTTCTLHSVMRRIFPSGFRAGFVLSFRWIPSELNCSNQRSRFFDREYAPPPDAKRPSRVSPCQRSAVRCPTPTLAFCWTIVNAKSRVKLARAVARVQGQPAGREEDSDTSDENEALPVPKSAQVVSGRRRLRQRSLANHRLCRDGRFEESLMGKAVRGLAARQSRRAVLDKFSQVCEDARFSLIGDVKVNDARVACPNDCFVLGLQHHHGSQLLAAVMGCCLHSAALGPDNCRRIILM